MTLPSPTATARRARLRYVNDGLPGYRRVRKGKGFAYQMPDGKWLKDEEELERIKSLVLPPAWEDVWICSYPNGHLQATGVDSRGRKQYRYHPDWNRSRSLTKFSKLPRFHELLPLIREHVARDLARAGLDKEKVLALVVDLMEKSCLRIGNEAYARENHSYGLTTLRDRHAQIEGSRLRFRFRGKKGVMQDTEVRDRRLARLVQRCKEIPGQELFQYLDEEGVGHPIDSGDVNAYLQEITGEELTAKDFRTWAGTLYAFHCLRLVKRGETEAERKSQLADVARKVACRLGNTPAVCRKYYIHPFLFEAFDDGRWEEIMHNKIRRRPHESEGNYEGRWVAGLLSEL